jgi:hypothetical protein
MSLIGTLDEIKLADVLRLFAAGKKTGVLKASRGASHALVSLRKGQVIHAESGATLGEDVILDLFGWKEGQLTFVPSEQPVVPNVSKDVDTLILEGLRVGETFHRMRALIPSDRVQFQMGPPPADGEARVTLGPKEWAVLRALDGVRDVREVVDACKLPRDTVVKAIFELASAGFVERVESQKSLRVQALGRAGGDVPAVDEKFEREWMKVNRFADGIVRIEVRTLAGRSARLPVAFRSGLFRDIQLPKATLAEISVREGEDVNVRPVA